MNILKNSVILITGGTGSFGNALTDRLLPMKPKQIIIFSRDEKKQSDMRNKYDSKLIHYVIGDVRDLQAVDDAMAGVDYVFHAAALKQVPACEFFPMEAYKTNVMGSNNVFLAVIKHKVKKVVVLSTDKAVFPINAYGMSKAMMEKLMIAHSRASKTVFCGVRYGNVMYSRGSVIPFFVESIKKNNPLLEITHPDMTRFLISLDDAVNLVLKTLKTGKSGKFYILRSPACTVAKLGQAVSDIFGIPFFIYKVVGARIGEKMHETLIEGYTSENARQLTVEEVKKLLKSLPEIRKELEEWQK